MATAKDVAEWMMKEVSDGTFMYQEMIVHEITQKFGDEFTYFNENGNPAIDKKVLREFRKLSGDTVVWLKGERAWRMREKGDSKGRQQDY